MYAPVRALSRGLAVLSELNAGGPSSAQDLARRTGLNHTTTYRLLDTLMPGGTQQVVEGDAAPDRVQVVTRCRPGSRSAAGR